MGGAPLEPTVLVVGLGNPGPQYQFTPHNAGFMAIDRIAERCGVAVSNRRHRALTAKARLAGRDVLLAKPETYMNESGVAVRALLDAMRGIAQAGGSSSDDAQAADLIVLYDDVDFALGTLRVKERGSSAGHNGVKSITASLGTQEWTRVRIGIAPQGTQAAETARLRRVEFVIAPMRKAELALLDGGVDKAAEAVEAILRDGVAAAMNTFNQRLAE